MLVTSHPVKNFSRENMIPRGGGAFLNEMDGNLTCMNTDGTMVTEIHWQGKFRGIDFGAIPFRLEVGKTDKLRDSKGRQFWTVMAHGWPYGTCPEGPRRGRTVPWPTLRGTVGTVRFAVDRWMLSGG